MQYTLLTWSENPVLFMSKITFRGSKQLYCLHVSLEYLTEFLSRTSAIFKDWLVSRVIIDILKGYTKEKPDGNPEKRTGGTYIIFMVSLFMEDLGQILCQER